MWSCCLCMEIDLYCKSDLEQTKEKASLLLIVIHVGNNASAKTAGRAHTSMVHVTTTTTNACTGDPGSPVSSPTTLTPLNDARSGNSGATARPKSIPGTNVFRITQSAEAVLRPVMESFRRMISASRNSCCGNAELGIRGHP